MKVTAKYKLLQQQQQQQQQQLWLKDVREVPKQSFVKLLLSDTANMHSY